MESLQKRREDGGADGFDGADGEDTGQFFGFSDGGLGTCQVFHDGGRVFIENGALMGQQCLFSDAVKKMDSQFIFQVLDLDGDSGLGVAERLSGFGETLQFAAWRKVWISRNSMFYLLFYGLICLKILNDIFKTLNFTFG